MNYKRIHVRVPIEGTATLRNMIGTHIGVKAIDISPEGLGVKSFPGNTTVSGYHVVVTLKHDVRILFTGELIKHQSSKTAGFKITKINGENLQIINKLIEDYQSTSDFIRQLDEFEILPQRYIDENGDELDITFEKE